MGMSMKLVPSFDEGITLYVQECSGLTDVWQTRTLRDFANGHMISLYQCEDGELYCRRDDGEFIRGWDTKANFIS